MRSVLGDVLWLALGAGLLAAGAYLWTRITVECVREAPGQAATCTVARHAWLGLTLDTSWNVSAVRHAGSRPVERTSGSSNSRPSFVLVLETPAGRQEVDSSHGDAVDAAADALNELLDTTAPGRARARLLVWLPGLFAMLPGFGFFTYGARGLGRRLSRLGPP